MAQLSGSASPGWAQFLAEEVRDRQFIDLLLDWGEAARQGETVTDACGDAFCVSFAPEDVTITHLYLVDWPAVRLSRTDFITALEARRGQLA